MRLNLVVKVETKSMARAEPVVVLATAPKVTVDGLTAGNTWLASFTAVNVPITPPEVAASLLIVAAIADVESAVEASNAPPTR